MATPKPFPHAGFLRDLEHLSASTPLTTATPLPPPLARILLATEAGQPTPIVADLIELLKARKAVLQASFDTGLVADSLRRYQKFAKPGQPPVHIVQLRQQQAAARQASNQSKQSFIKAAAAFVRAAGIDVPPRVGLELFITRWIDANVPKEPLARRLPLRPDPGSGVQDRVRRGSPCSPAVSPGLRTHGDIKLELTQSRPTEPPQMMLRQPESD